MQWVFAKSPKKKWTEKQQHHFSKERREWKLFLLFSFQTNSQNAKKLMILGFKQKRLTGLRTNYWIAKWIKWSIVQKLNLLSSSKFNHLQSKDGSDCSTAEGYTPRDRRGRGFDAGLFLPYQKCDLNQIPCNITNFSIKMLKWAAWCKARLLQTDWAKNNVLLKVIESAVGYSQQPLITKIFFISTPNGQAHQTLSVLTPQKNGKNLMQQRIFLFLEI